MFLCSLKLQNAFVNLWKALIIRNNDNHIYLNTNSPSSNWIFQAKRCLVVPLKQAELFPGTFHLFNNWIPSLSYWYFASLTAHVCSMRVRIHMAAHSNRSIFRSLFPLKLNSCTYYVQYNTNPIGPLRCAITDYSVYVILLFSKCCQS